MNRYLGDENLASLVTKTFLRKVPQKIANIKRDLMLGNVSGMVQHTQAIRRSAETVGAERIVRLVGEFENTEFGVLPDDTGDDLVEKLEDELKLFKNEINALN